MDELQEPSLCQKYRLEFALFAFLFLTYAYFSPSAGHNEAARYDTIRAWIDEGRLAVDNYVYNSADLIKYKDEHYYSSKAPGTSYLGLPAFWLSDRLLRLFHLPSSMHYHLVCYLTSVFSIALISALSGVFIFKFLRILNMNVRPALALTLSYSLGTMAFPFSTLFISHQATAAFLFIAFYFLFSLRQPLPSVKATFNKMLISGFCLGFSITLEYPAAIAVLLLSLYGLYHIQKNRNFKHLIPLALGTVLGISLLLIYNIIAFKNAFYIPYESYAHSTESTFTAHQKGFLGIRLPFLEPAFWPTFLNNLEQITILPLRGLFILTPLTVLALPGFICLFASIWRQKQLRSETLLCFFLFLAYLVFNASYGDSVVYWGGGYSFGPRHTLPALPFLIIPLWALTQNHWLRWLVPPVALLSIFFCLAATAVDPHTPYAPSNPLLEMYIPYFAQAQFALEKAGVFSNELLTADSVAFNWGKILGLKGHVQLFPLYFIWLMLGLCLFKRRTPTAVR